MRLFIFITNIIMGIVLSRFAISKLAGWDISVNAFIEMAKPIGIDPTFFRIVTGFLILTVTLGYIFTALYTVLIGKLRFKFSYALFAKGANLLGLLTMVGALIAEFTLRVQPKWLLVYIAAGVVLLSATNLYLLKNTESIKN